MEDDMGTRSITVVYDESDLASTGKEAVVCMYRQYDGYPSGHGADLARFLDGLHVVNGLAYDEKRRVANGAGCLAAQMVAHFKAEPGGIYLLPCEASTGDAYIDYTYEVHVRNAGEEVLVTVRGRRGQSLFYGPPDHLLQWCDSDEEE